MKRYTHEELAQIREQVPRMDHQALAEMLRNILESEEQCGIDSDEEFNLTRDHMQTSSVVTDRMHSIGIGWAGQLRARLSDGR